MDAVESGAGRKEELLEDYVVSPLVGQAGPSGGVLWPQDQIDRGLRVIA